MKILTKIAIPILILIASVVHAQPWKAIAHNTYSIYGTHVIDSDSGTFAPIAEIVYNSDFDSFGISLISEDGKRNPLPYGVFRLKTCNMDTMGAIAGHILKDPASEDQMNSIFIKCDRPAYLRIWNVDNNYSLYKFEDVGPITEK